MIGELIEAERRLQGLGQYELAARAGIPAPTLSRIENGVILNPGVKTLRRIANALGVPLDMLCPPSITADADGAAA